VRRMISCTGVEGYIACGSAVRDMAQTTLLLMVKAPTLVLVGRQDPACTVDQATVIHRMIDGSRMVVLEDAAHLSNIEQPRAPPEEEPPLRAYKFTRLPYDPGQQPPPSPPPKGKAAKDKKSASTRTKPAAKTPKKDKKSASSRAKPVAAPKPKTPKSKKPASSLKPAAKPEPDAEPFDINIPAFLATRVARQAQEPEQEDPPPPSTRPKPRRP